MIKKKILLTGASGSVGFRVFEELLSYQEDFDLTLFLRKSKKNINMFKPFLGMIKIKWGNLEDYNDVLKAVDGNDIVIHLAAIIPPKSEENPERTHLVNVEGTKNVINAMLKQENKPKIIYTSSICIYRNKNSCRKNHNRFWFRLYHISLILLYIYLRIKV
ncbi:MAG: NAD-dependent epimerase/dehydratase family protein [Promethearchaeota archaeon]